MTTEVFSDRRSELVVLRRWAIPTLAILLIVLSLPWFTWQFLPAQPSNQIPEMHLTFGDIRGAAGNSTSPLTRIYFEWGMWILIIPASVLALAATKYSSKLVGVMATCAAGLVLVVTVLAFKGVLSWSAFLATVPNLRLGGFMFLIGLVLLLVHGVASVRSRDWAEQHRD